MTPQLFKITSINEDGVSVEVYAVSPNHRMIRKMMTNEYGNVEIEAVDIENAPEYVKEQILQTEE